MAFYTDAIAALLNNGKQQVLPISMANLIELAKDKDKFNNGKSVQDALSYLAGAFAHADDAANTAETNAKNYADGKIDGLNVAYVGSATDAGHDKFISYIYQENGYIHAFAQDMSAAKVTYSGSDGRATVADELQHINATIADNLTATTLKLFDGDDKEVENKTVTADGTVYQLKQGTELVAKFNIEKDSFVKSGAVVRGTKDAQGNVIEDSTGKTGEYFIKLEIRTHDDTGTGAAEHTLYIPAESLVDAYSAKNDDNNVTITVDQDKNTISATIKAGGVGTTELAASAVTTEKIADKNVTKAKLEQPVQTSLGKADTAVQSVTTGTTAGTIAVDGTDVNVKDLKTVATSGKASDVTIDAINNLNAIAGESKTVTNVQDALSTLANKVNAINDGAVTSIVTSVTDNGKDANSLVNISMTSATSAKGNVTVALTHNLGGAAALDYDMKNVATPVSSDFWESFK